MFSISKEGNYTPGLHKVTLEKVEFHLVTAYPLSTTRKRNFDSFVSIIKGNLFDSRKSIISTVWLDGSFCTHKLNPKDIDGAILCKVETEDHLNEFFELVKLFHNKHINNAHDFFKRNYCDLYIIMELESAKNLHTIGIETGNDVIIAIAERAIYAYNYWLDHFGSDRDNIKKAIYSIDIRKEMNYYE